MATNIDSSAEFGITIPFEVKDNATPSIKALVNHISKIYNTFKAAGRSSDDASRAVNNFAVALKNLFSGSDKYKKLTENLDSALKKVKELQESGKNFSRSGNVNGVRDIDRFLKTATRAFLEFKAAAMPGQALRRFASQCEDINFKLSTMAMTAGMSVGKLSELGNAFRSYGGSASDAVRGQRSYELAMEQRRRGQGNGGVYTEAWKRYGIQYNENDTYQEYFKRLIRWSEGLGTGRQADAKRINLRQILGLTDAEFRVMKGGMRAWNEEQKINEKYKSGSEDAAVAAEDLTKATAHMTAAWQDLKNRAFVALEPILSKVYGSVKGIVDALSSMPKWVFSAGAWIMTIVSALGALAAVMKGFKLLSVLLGVFRGGGLLSRFGSLFSIGGGTATKMAGGPVSAASSVIRSTGGAVGGRLGGWFGMGMNVGNLIANGVTAGKVSAMNDNVGRIITILTAWMQVWMLRMGASGFNGSRKELINYYNQAMWNMDWKSDAVRNTFAVGMANAHKQQRWLDQSAYAYYKDGTVKDTENSSVSVGKIEITVNSENANAQDVAEAVHEKIIEEFRILASQDNTTEMR